MKNLIVAFVVSLFLVSCGNTRNNSGDLCIVLNDGVSYTIPESKISSYYASICIYVAEQHINAGLLQSAYNRFDMIHKDKVAYATLWLIERGYEKRVIYELEKVASHN